jgi:hypothetical protein
MTPPNQKPEADLYFLRGQASLPLLVLDSRGKTSRMADEYPRYMFFPRTKSPPTWVAEVLGVFRKHRDKIDTKSAPHSISDEVLAILRPDLERIGFKVESGKRQTEKLLRPVLFGEMGSHDVKYEIDAFQETNKIVLEVEAGRSIMGNAIFRDIIQMSLMVDADHAVIAMPQVYRYKSGGKTMTNRAYEDGFGILDALWSSDRLHLPFKGLLLVGY